MSTSFLFDFLITPGLQADDFYMRAAIDMTNYADTGPNAMDKLHATLTPQLSSMMNTLVVLENYFLLLIGQTPAVPTTAQPPSNNSQTTVAPSVNNSQSTVAPSVNNSQTTVSGMIMS